MRELKFRAWDRKHKEYEYSDKSTMHSFWKWCQYDSTTPIEQFTGLYDKNGNEIYEGDIVKGFINFGPGGDLERIWAIKIHPLGPNVQGWQWREDQDNSWALPVVVGNIHETPELLEQEQ